MVALSWAWVVEERKLADDLVVMETPFRRVVVVVKDTDYGSQSGVRLTF